MKKIVSAALVLVLLLSAVCASAATITLKDAMGVVDNSSYRNSALGFGFSYPTWKITSQTEQLRNQNLSSAYLSMNAQTVLSVQGNVQVMSASQAGGLSNVNVGVSYSSEISSLISLLGADYILNTMVDYLKDNLEKQMTGYRFKSSKIVEVTISGRTVSCLHIVGTYLNMDIHQMLCVVPNDGYMISFTATSISESSVRDIMQHFFWM